MMQLLGAFAVLAFGLAAAGIYGVLSFLTSQRRREIGLRIAMGARTTDILGMVVREGMTMVGTGVIVGLGATVAAARILSASLSRLTHGPADAVRRDAAARVCGTRGVLPARAPGDQARSARRPSSRLAEITSRARFDGPSSRRP